MATIKFSMEQYAQYLGKLGPRLKQAGARGIRAGAQRAVVVLQTATREAGAFDTGYYLRAWKTQPIPNGAEVWNDAPYAPIIEGGRRPGSRMPPSKVVVAWAQRKLGLSAEEAKAAAFPIARAIAKRGLKPRRVMTNAIESMKRLVNEEIEAEIKKELAKP